MRQSITDKVKEITKDVKYSTDPKDNKIFDLELEVRNLRRNLSFWAHESKTLKRQKQILVRAIDKQIHDNECSLDYSHESLVDEYGELLDGVEIGVDHYKSSNKRLKSALSRSRK